MQRVTVALDWTPNSNHAGLFLARHLGFYSAAGLDVHLLSPDSGHSSTSSASSLPRLTPARQVAAGQADFAVGPSESAVSFATTEAEKERLVVVATLLQRSTSAICTLRSSGIDSPAKLEGKRYATYGGRFEDDIVRELVRRAGGDGSKVQFVPLQFHGYSDEVVMAKGSVVASSLALNHSDATWIFSHVEGVLAARAGEELNQFRLEDYGLAYGYHPVLLARRSALTDPIARAFLAATAEGYKRAAADPASAAAALLAISHSAVADQDFVLESARSIADKILTENGEWGVMKGERWKAFVDLLVEAKALKDRGGNVIARQTVDDQALFSNALLLAK